jgi:ABC transporter substrate binding protein
MSSGSARQKTPAVRAVQLCVCASFQVRSRTYGRANQRFRELAEDLVALKVDIILTWGTEAALQAKRATRTIPIVMGAIGDPLAQGIVSSLARPGGNVTGLTSLSGELEGKRLELLKEIIPNLSLVAVLVNPTNRYTGPALQHARLAAETLKIMLRVHETHDATTLDNELDSLSRERPRAPRLRRSVSGEPTAADRAIRTEARTAIGLHLPRARRGGRVDLLCAELPRFVPARRHLRG